MSLQSTSGYSLKRLFLKYDGKCVKCGRWIRAGEEAYWEKGRGVWHIECSVPQSSSEDEKVHRQGYKTAGKIMLASVFFLFLALIVRVTQWVAVFATISLAAFFFGIFAFSNEFMIFHRWKRWYGKARPYAESSFLMYPYNPYPNVTCWNCGQLVRKPDPFSYVKPKWRKVEDSWMAFCSKCNANVTKEVIEAKYGHAYTKERLPKFLHETSLFRILSRTQICANCGFETPSKSDTCANCGMKQKS